MRLHDGRGDRQAQSHAVRLGGEKRFKHAFMQYVGVLKQMSGGGLDINVAGDFLVMAATLMEIKSALLLPKPPVPPGEEGSSAAAELADPRYELVQKLLEYKKFKDTATALAHQQHLHENRFPRFPASLDDKSDEPPPIDLEEVQIWDLLGAFNRLMQEVGLRKPREHDEHGQHHQD